MKPRHDQHFLIDRNAVSKIVGAVDVRGRRVLEIGPGEGVLTCTLLEQGAHVIAVELDRRLFENLAVRFSAELATGQLTLIHGNAVQCDLPPFDLVVANLPYSASSKITFRLLDIGFETAVLMYQKEFGQRMIALPGTPECGRLSVMVQTYARVKPILELSPNAFRPKPQVRSWVMKITPRDPPHPIKDRTLYADVVRALFSHRRKTVRKALKASRTLLGDERVDTLVQVLPADILQARPEALSLEAFARIANAVS
ncbi:MAG: 16S rRNA (adenine(1518)-N(6)/adenine(1519)-N(6))-dimethyltransferase RsmA [Methanomicrobiaceae archaeon]|nr:16S rRNA (adenine(1518)-N(6)/adenine(1519)-N(6))-dimethyltransferase RsmA [Methanomicrobiaceae archaeon]